MQHNKLLLCVVVCLFAGIIMLSSCKKDDIFDYDRLIGEWLVVSPEADLNCTFSINDTVRIGVVPVYPEGYFDMINAHTEYNGTSHSTQYQCIVDSENHEMRLRRSGDITRRYDILVLKKNKVVLRRKGRDELIELKRLSDDPGPHYV